MTTIGDLANTSAPSSVRLLLEEGEVNHAPTHYLGGNWLLCLALSEVQYNDPLLNFLSFEVVKSRCSSGIKMEDGANELLQGRVGGWRSSLSYGRRPPLFQSTRSTQDRMQMSRQIGIYCLVQRRTLHDIIKFLESSHR